MVREIANDPSINVEIVGVAARASNEEIASFVEFFELEDMTTLVGDETWSHFGVVSQPSFRLYIPGEGVERVGGLEEAIDRLAESA